MQKIMFNDKYSLTKAVLEGKKTQTRRVIQKSQLKDIEKFQEEFFNDTLDFLEGKELLEQYFLVERRKKPRYAVKETVAVAIPYKQLKFYGVSLSEKTLLWTRHEIEPDISIRNSPGWNNKMFVKAELMPHQIRITNIRLQRLQDISDNDCLKEGIKKSWWMGASGKPLYGFGNDDRYTSPREAYAALIDKVSGKGTWERNPWVFVYDFELVK